MDGERMNDLEGSLFLIQSCSIGTTQWRSERPISFSGGSQFCQLLVYQFNGETTCTRCLPSDTRILDDTRIDDIVTNTDQVESTSFVMLAVAGLEFLIGLMFAVAHFSRKQSSPLHTPPASQPIHASPRMPIRPDPYEMAVVSI